MDFSIYKDLKVTEETLDKLECDILIGNFKIEDIDNKIIINVGNSIFDIANIMEKTIKINQCLDDEANCSLHATDYCQVRKFYIRLQNTIEKEMKSMTIDKLINFNN